MGYRITIQMALAEGAEARLWAIVSQRRADVSRAAFEKDRVEQHIRAVLDIETDHWGARRLMRQLARHRDIHSMTLDGSEVPMDIGQRPVALKTHRIRTTKTKEASR